MPTTVNKLGSIVAGSSAINLRYQCEIPKLFINGHIAAKWVEQLFGSVTKTVEQSRKCKVICCPVQVWIYLRIICD
jgi:hypothetical protein